MVTPARPEINALWKSIANAWDERMGGRMPWLHNWTEAERTGYNN
jgi:hypothetical protein